MQGENVIKQEPGYAAEMTIQSLHTLSCNGPKLLNKGLKKSTRGSLELEVNKHGQGGWQGNYFSLIVARSVSYE